MPDTAAIAAHWNIAAATFDTEPDHGLTRPAVRAAWSARLRSWIPGDGVDVLDVGCGTGSLSLLAAEHGHRVTAIDLAPEMVALARRKLAGHDARVLVADASAPPIAHASTDVVLARHLLWTLPDPVTTLRRWVRLLRPGGHLVLVEGCWDVPDTGDGPGTPWSRGVPATVLADAVRPLVTRLHTEHLTDPALWGRMINDERYVLLAHI